MLEGGDKERDHTRHDCIYSGIPLNRPHLRPVKVSLLEGWPHFRGEFVLKKHASGLFEVA